MISKKKEYDVREIILLHPLLPIY